MASSLRRTIIILSALLSLLVAVAQPASPNPRRSGPTPTPGFAATCPNRKILQDALAGLRLFRVPKTHAFA
ncbi:MAG: hypothetical protein JST22_04955 [Bacteroidetes bacterium]|nr:hypothetical protein [Bacteroidota bacterium]